MEKISDIKRILGQTAPEDLPVFIGRYNSDQRSGVVRLTASAQKSYDSYQHELERVSHMLEFETRYAEAGVICGIDEAGRGPLAGPVAAAAVILAPDDPILYVNDSKQLSAKKRESLFAEIMSRAVSVGVGLAGPDVIDDINILQADYQAMRDAISQLSPGPQLCLNDAVTIPGLSIRQIPIIHGDAKSLSIAAASIIAKVTRDRIMDEYDRQYPEYGFARHKGYGTAEHIQAIRKYGPCPIHRRSFITHFI